MFNRLFVLGSRIAPDSWGLCGSLEDSGTLRTLRDCIPPPLVRLLPVPVRTSHSTARKLVTIEFRCCMLLLQKPLSDFLEVLSSPRTSSSCWKVQVSACLSWLLVMSRQLDWFLGRVRVPFFIVWGVVRWGPSTPYGFFISFLPGFVRFSPNTLVLVSLSDRACPRDSMLVTVFFGTLGNLEIFYPGVIGDSASRLMPRFWKGQDETENLELLRWGPQSSLCGLLEISRASYGLIRSGCIQKIGLPNGPPWRKLGLSTCFSILPLWLESSRCRGTLQRMEIVPIGHRHILAGG
ncbi:hypothetical protein F2Q69_00006864 [Brassica cretica]|uniref:Uncharacterized protein n=1 Tax=Brassica cretica TaxID=69181 RepID=A0A8S9P728_BRACR|nr:hypothetical protein F2Q69_00006864 [Brassica cretica]